MMSEHASALSPYIIVERVVIPRHGNRYEGGWRNATGARRNNLPFSIIAVACAELLSSINRHAITTDSFHHLTTHHPYPSLTEMLAEAIADLFLTMRHGLGEERSYRDTIAPYTISYARVIYA